MALVSGMTEVISIHAPREGGDNYIVDKLLSDMHFNPRPPRGGRPVHRILFTRQSRFQSTPPARGATMLIAAFQMIADISIHAPREGGDH